MSSHRSCLEFHQTSYRLTIRCLGVKMFAAGKARSVLPASTQRSPPCVNFQDPGSCQAVHNPIRVSLRAPSFLYKLSPGGSSPRTWSPWISACERSCTLDRLLPEFQTSTLTLTDFSLGAISWKKVTSCSCLDWYGDQSTVTTEVGPFGGSS